MTTTYSHHPRSNPPSLRTFLGTAVDHPPRGLIPARRFGACLACWFSPYRSGSSSSGTLLGEDTSHSGVCTSFGEWHPLVRLAGTLRGDYLGRRPFGGLIAIILSVLVYPPREDPFLRPSMVVSEGLFPLSLGFSLILLISLVLLRRLILSPPPFHSFIPIRALIA